MMEAHQERVVEEKAELDARLARLTAFIGGDVFPTLDGPERLLLAWQRDAMAEYSRVLGARIRFFGGK